MKLGFSVKWRNPVPMPRIHTLGREDFSMFSRVFEELCLLGICLQRFLRNINNENLECPGFLLWKR